MIQEANGSIIATVLFGEGYRVDNTNRSKTVTVRDNSDTLMNVPILSIAPDSNKPVPEDEKVPFLISSNISTTKKFNVQISVDDGTGDFLASNQSEPFEFPNGEKSYVHNVTLDDDNVDELNGKVILTLLSDTNNPTNYVVAASPANKASVVVSDNDDAPEISIVPVTPIVTEGADIQFRVTASSASTINYDNRGNTTDPTIGLRVNLSISGQVNEFVEFDQSTDLSAGLPKYVEIPTGDTDVILTIPTDDDSFDELDGRISVSLLPAKFTRDIPTHDNENESVTVYPEAIYTIDEDSKFASVSILDNDLPTLTIADGSPITEGETAIFALSLSPAPTSPVAVFVRVNQTNGNFLDLTSNLQRVEISTQGVGTLEVETEDDNMDELDGQIIAILSQDNVSPPRYQIGNVLLDQVGNVLLGSTPTGVSAAVEVSDNDTNLPRVSISTTTESVVEGNPFTVSLQSDSTLSADSTITVTLEVSDSGQGDGYFNSYSPNPITLIGTSPTNVTINTNGDDLDEDDGQITVTVSDGTNYIAGENNFVSVAVTDDEVDLPEVSISSGNYRITEGAFVDFVVRMTPPPGIGETQDITLNVSQSVPSSDFYNATTPSQLTIDNTGLARGRITTNDDNVEEASGKITVSVLGVASQYRPASTPNNSIEIDVYDNDGPIVIVSDFTVLEEMSDQTHNLEFELSRAANQDVSIEYSVAPGGNASIGDDFMLGGTSPIVILAGQTTGQIPITIKGDTLSDSQEIFFLNLVASNAMFENGLNSSLVVGTIAEKPVVSITSRFGQLSNTDEFEYIVSAEPALTSNLDVMLQVIDSPANIIDSGDESITVQLTSTATSKVQTLSFNTNTPDLTPVIVSISENGSYHINPRSRSVAVQVDDGTNLPAISITGDGSISEGDVATFTIAVDTNVVRSGAISVKIQTVEGGTDFIAGPPATSILIPVNQSQVTYSVQTREYDPTSGGNGTITATIEPGAGYKRADAQGRSATVSVLNDGGLPVITFTSLTNTVAEGGELLYPFNISGTVNGDEVITLLANSGTTATFETDFIFDNSSTIRIGSGDTSGTIKISALSDQLYEGGSLFTESFSIQVMATHAKFSNDLQSITLTGTIQDEDNEPIISISNASAPEDVGKNTPSDTLDDNMHFEVSLSVASALDVIFYYETLG